MKKYTVLAFMVVLVTSVVVNMEKSAVSMVPEPKVRYQQCVGNLSANPVSQIIVDSASFNEKNSFSLGERVITKSGNNYFYSCVTQTSLRNKEGHEYKRIRVMRNFPTDKTIVEVPVRKVGKLEISNK